MKHMAKMGKFFHNQFLLTLVIKTLNAPFSVHGCKKERNEESSSSFL